MYLSMNATYPEDRRMAFHDWAVKHIEPVSPALDGEIVLVLPDGTWGDFCNPIDVILGEVYVIGEDSVHGGVLVAKY